MTPKEKAKELVNAFEHLVLYDFTTDDKPFFDYQKQCALIAVDEIIDSHYKLLSGINQSVYNYWNEVKQEINKL